MRWPAPPAYNFARQDSRDSGENPDSHLRFKSTRATLRRSSSTDPQHTCNVSDHHAKTTHDCERKHVAHFHRSSSFQIGAGVNCLPGPVCVDVI